MTALLDSNSNIATLLYGFRLDSDSLRIVLKLFHQNRATTILDFRARE